MYEPDMDIAILWAERCRQEFLDVDFGSAILMSSAAAGEITTTAATTAAASAGAGDLNDTLTGNQKIHENQTAAPTSMSPSIRFLTFNHLLYGKSHKKEAQIVSLASKLGHIGFVVYGTPGIIGLLIMTNSTNNNGSGGGCTEEEDVNEFAKECNNRIGKRATVLDFELKFTSDGGLLSSFEGVRNGSNDDDGGKKNQSLSQSKKSKKSKGNGNDKNNKGNNNNSSSGSTGGSSTPQLVNLLGAERVTTQNGSVSTTNMKSGLRQFDSLAELKEVLPGDVVQNVLGL